MLFSKLLLPLVLSVVVIAPITIGTAYGEDGYVTRGVKKGTDVTVGGTKKGINYTVDGTKKGVDYTVDGTKKGIDYTGHGIHKGLDATKKFVKKVF
jgi:hypothetical protein